MKHTKVISYLFSISILSPRFEAFHFPRKGSNWLLQVENIEKTRKSKLICSFRLFTVETRGQKKEKRYKTRNDEIQFFFSVRLSVFFALQQLFIFFFRSMGKVVQVRTCVLRLLVRVLLSLRDIHFDEKMDIKHWKIGIKLYHNDDEVGIGISRKSLTNARNTKYNSQNPSSAYKYLFHELISISAAQLDLEFHRSQINLAYFMLKMFVDANSLFYRINKTFHS